MHNATSIANFFIRKGIEDGKPIDQMKVQKLVYFAHGWYLAITNKPLLNEAIEAWRFGPVIPSLYHSLKYSGNQAITSTISVRKDPTIDETDPEVQAYLNRIWNLYSPLSGIQLSNITHEEETPWARIAKEFNNQIPADKDIDNESIKQYFLNQRKETLKP
jgi:uncharacterized phage-associated protein